MAYEVYILRQNHLSLHQSCADLRIALALVEELDISPLVILAANYTVRLTNYICSDGVIKNYGDHLDYESALDLARRTRQELEGMGFQFNQQGDSWSVYWGNDIALSLEIVDENTRLYIPSPGSFAMPLSA